jgi:hypothetical protein
VIANHNTCPTSDMHPSAIDRSKKLLEGFSIKTEESDNAETICSLALTIQLQSHESVHTADGPEYAFGSLMIKEDE